jgi:uncharacterized protein (DUF2267 family)
VYHARAVLDALQAAVSAGEMRDVLQDLSDDYAPLFSGTRGKLRRHGRGH